MKRGFVTLLTLMLGFALPAHSTERKEVVVHVFDPPLNLTYGTTDDPRMKAVPMLDAYRAFYAVRTFKSFQEWKKHLTDGMIEQYSLSEDVFKRMQDDPSQGE